MHVNAGACKHGSHRVLLTCSSTSAHILYSIASQELRLAGLSLPEDILLRVFPVAP